MELATKRDIDELETLYNRVNDYSAKSINYAGWVKGMYPTRLTAEEGVMSESLFILKKDGRIAGSVVLNSNPDVAYDGVMWDIDCDYAQIIIVHTLAVHPDFRGEGIGKQIMVFVEEYARRQEMLAIRLDTSELNKPAIAMYEKLGYSYKGKVDLKIGYEHLRLFHVYEKLI